MSYNIPPPYDGERSSFRAQSHSTQSYINSILHINSFPPYDGNDFFRLQDKFNFHINSFPYVGSYFLFASQLDIYQKNIFIFIKQTQCNYTAKAVSLEAKSNTITSKKQCCYKVLSMIYSSTSKKKYAIKTLKQPIVH